MIRGLINESIIIETKENNVWQFRTLALSILRRLFQGLQGGLLGGLGGVLFRIFTGSLEGNLVTNVIGGLTIGLAFGLILGLTLGLIMVFVNVLRETRYHIIQINTPYQRFKASAKVFYFSILQHWHLRYLLSKKGLLPFKLVSFLNDMVRCNILETTGASWRFRHRILQDYFSDQWVETEFEPEQK